MDTRGTGRTFEEYDAAVEWSRSAEADAVKISLPGFKREEIRVLVDNHGHLRTRGERAVAGSRWSRFQKDFQLPADCNVDGIRAKFENETLTITLPKKTPSPSPVLPYTPSPVTPPQPEPRRPPAAPLPGVRTPPSPTRRAPEPSPAPVPAPAPSQRPPAERRPSLPRKPSVPEPAAPAPAPEPVTPKKSDLATLMKPKEEDTTKPLSQPAAAEEGMEREARGKLEEDRKTLEEERKRANDEGMNMAQLRRPASTSRRQLVNVAVAVVVLLGITLYVWNTLRNAATGGGAGDHGHGHGGALGHYNDEM